MKKLFYILLLCFSFTSCTEGYHNVVVIKKERIQHTIKSDRFFIIAVDDNGNKHSFDVLEGEFVRTEIGDTICKYY